jgi:hypothetical protein
MTDTLDAIAREMEADAQHWRKLADQERRDENIAAAAAYEGCAAYAEDYAHKLTALSNQGEGAVAIAEVISGYEFGDSGAESKVRWLLNPMPVGAYLYEQPEAEADRRDAERLGEVCDYVIHLAEKADLDYDAALKAKDHDAADAIVNRLTAINQIGRKLGCLVDAATQEQT